MMPAAVGITLVISARGLVAFVDDLIGFIHTRTRQKALAEEEEFRNRIAFAIRQGIEDAKRR
jgi:hypothetical protein